MGDSFSITTASGTVELDGNRQGSASFSVTNVSTHAIRAHAEVHAEAVVAQPAATGARGAAAQAPPSPDTSWFAIAGAAERSFPVGGTEVYRVDVTVPAPAAPAPGAAPRRYRLRLDVIGADDPDEDQAQGQWVEFTVAPQPAPPRRIPWLWILIAAAAVVVVAAAIGITLGVLSHRQGTFSVTPTTVNFGSVTVSHTGTQTVTVKNTGPVGTTVIAKVVGANAGDFRVGTASCLGATLAANATCAFQVTFTPPTRGGIVGSLQLSGDHASTHTFALTGTGVGPAATAHVSLVHTALFIWTYTVTITNTGDTPLHVTNALVSGELGVQTNGCANTAVAPNQSCQIVVANFISSGTAPTGILSVYSDAAGSPLRVNLGP